MSANDIPTFVLLGLEQVTRADFSAMCSSGTVLVGAGTVSITRTTMLLTLTRTAMTPMSTEGELRVDDEFLCFTLELPVVDGLPGSAIPPGTYPVVLAPSPKFEAVQDGWVQGYATSIPHIINIPNRTDILIHWGNYPHDTEGCVLVGFTKETDFIGMSRGAFDALHAKLASATDPINITVQ